MRTDPVEQPVENASGLLAELAVHEKNAIRRASQVQFCAAGDVLLHAKSRSRFVFFPINAVLMLVRPATGRNSVALGLFGNDGLLGLDAILDTKTQPDDAIVQSAGFLHCIPAVDLLNQFQATGRLQKSILRFTHGFLEQVAQNTFCQLQHPLRQRLARWLLMVDDRSGSIEVAKARQLLSIALGAEESEIGRALAALAGVVDDGRSTISIERDALEVAACECYETGRSE